MKPQKEFVNYLIKKPIRMGQAFFLGNSSNNIKYLITNNHVISKEIIDSNITIIIEIYNKKTFELKLNRNQRYIQFFEEPIDITLIEINDLKELCLNVKFLEIDYNYMKGSNNIYLNNDVFLLGYPFGNNVECSDGKIANILNYEFENNWDTN